MTEDHQVSASVVARCLLPVYGGAAESPAPWAAGSGLPSPQAPLWLDQAGQGAPVFTLQQS